MARRGSCRKLGHNKRTCQKSAEIGESSANSWKSEMEVITEVSPMKEHVIEPHVTSTHRKGMLKELSEISMLTQLSSITLMLGLDL